jgi:glycopeptide antibiotics resistance protein
VHRRRLVLWGALVVYAAAALVVLLSPGAPSGVIDAVTGWVRGGLGATAVRQGWIEFAANIALFVPLGFLLTGLFRRPWAGFAVALALSVAAELVQLLLPARLPSLRDVLANALGAATGAAFAWAFLIRRPRRRRPQETTRVR